MQYLQVLLKHYLQKALKILNDRLVVIQQKDENGIWKIAERKEEKIDQ